VIPLETTQGSLCTSLVQQAFLKFSNYKSIRKRGAMKFPGNNVGQPISKTSFYNNWLLVCGKEVTENYFLLTSKQNVSVFFDVTLEQLVYITAGQWHS
jgi:hypothetical protein